MFGPKRRPPGRDVTEISKASSPKAGTDIDKQIQDFSGDVGKMEFDKKKEPKEKSLDRDKAKRTKKTKQNRIRSSQVPKTVQQSIPYKRVYIHGMMEPENGIFTKSYRLTDANFRTTTQEAQDEMYFAYGDLLNYFSPDMRPQLVIFNRSIDKERFKEETLFAEQDDVYNGLRKDLNQVLLSKISEGQSNIVQEKYLVVSVKAENIETAFGTFSRIDGEVSARIKAINEASTDPMELQERLEVLYNIYNQDAEVPFFKKMNIDGNEARSFDIEWMHQLGLTTKDMIGPSSMTFENDHFRLGDTFGRSLFLKNLPTQLSAEVLTDIANIPCNAITSVHFSPMRQDEAIKLVRNQMLEINRNMAEAAKRAAKAGLGADLVSPDLMQSKKDADKAYDDITVRDQKTILMSVVVTVFADDMEDLDKYTKMAQNNAEKHLCTLMKLNSQQERGFQSCLPLGSNKIWANRLMNTEAAALFIPFESQELVQAGGNYYGVNATSRNLIMINRLRGQNSNGLILGMPGSGKSFSAKLEMTQVFL